jgi:hypothetical protein
VRRVLACGGAVVVRGMPDGKVGVGIHVAVDLSGQERYGTGWGYRNSNKCEYKGKMGQGAKQAHGSEANDASDRPQPYTRAKPCA